MPDEGATFKTFVNERRVFEIVGEHWVLEVEQIKGKLWFEMKDKNDPEDSHGGFVSEIAAEDFMEALKKITE